MTGPESILARVRTEADRGIHLTTIGFGMGNYNDVLMEQLADRGDGNHYYVDDIDEARRVFVENLTGTLQIIAKDAKVQVEFDSTRVLRYRLLGFENRDIADRDFRNDRVDAGEIGAGHEVTALYEVKLAPEVTRGTLASVRLRYALPDREGQDAPEVREIEERFDARSLSPRFDEAEPRFRLAAAVAEFAEILRGSYWAKESRMSDVLRVARSATRDLRDVTSDEFVSLVRKAESLRARAKSHENDE
jgi:Ca-activated chloride channel family protein